jgi:hypothetical protein
MEPEQFLQLMTAITEVKTEQYAMRRELLGNGQPGRVQIIEKKLAEVETTAEGLQTGAAGLRWKLGTISAVGGSLLAILLQWFVKHFTHVQ